MKLSSDDKAILKDLCNQFDVSYEKMLRLLDTVKEFEFKDRRTGIYNALSDIIKSDMKASNSKK
jgi:hypothetical protein